MSLREEWQQYNQNLKNADWLLSHGFQNIEGNWKASYTPCRPQPNQKDFCNDFSRFSFLQGGLRAGKTWAGAYKALKACIRYPGSLGSFCGPALEKHVNQLMLPQFESMLHPSMFYYHNYSEQTCYFSMPGWNVFTTINLYSMGNKGAYIAYKGKEFDWGWCDEPLNCNEESFLFWKESRFSKKGSIRAVWSTSHPGDPRSWFKLMMDRDSEKNLLNGYPKWNLYIISTLDNTYIADEAKSEMLSDYHGARGSVYVKGDQWLRIGSGMFNVDKFENVDQQSLPLHEMRRYIFVDTATGMKENSDRFVVATVGVRDFDPNVYILDVFAERNINPRQQIEIIKSMHDTWRPIRTAIEENYGGAYLARSCAEEGVRGITTIPSKESKTIRAQPFADVAEMGRVRLATDSSRKDNQIKTEFSDFPNGSHDDIVDAVCGAYNISGYNDDEDGILPKDMRKR